MTGGDERPMYGTCRPKTCIPEEVEGLEEYTT